MVSSLLSRSNSAGCKSRRRARAMVEALESRELLDGAPFAITGHTLVDVTGNGLTPDDTALPGVTVNIYQDTNASGKLDAGDIQLDAATTDGTGFYQFNVGTPGTYFLTETVPMGYTLTAPLPPVYVVVGAVNNTYSGNDFDNFQPITITGKTLTDVTGNSFTADDTNLSGVTVNLYKNGGATPFATTITLSDGSYAFANVGPGNYVVQETVPAGSTETGGQAGYTINAVSGGVYANNNFDNFSNITISGTTYTDLTNNSFSADDTALSGVTVNLYKNGATTPSATMVTAANGTFSFTNVGPGNYSVQETVPTGYTETGGQAGYSITAVSGGVYTNNNFDNYLPPVAPPTFALSGHVYEDQTGNGLTTDDTGHPMGGVTIQLFKVVNGTPVQVGQTTTASDGSYTFTGQTAGTFGIGEIVPTGYTETAPTSTFYQINATGTTTSLDFDNFKPITISGTTFTDITNNSFSSDDTVLPGVTVNLYKNGGTTPVATVVTASNGTYSFTNLGGGTYTVQEIVPAGQTETGGTAGYTIVATSGLNSTGNNFDNFKPITISGTTYTDLTGNSFSSDDTVLSGVTVNLYQNGGTTPFATTVSASNGTFSFTNLTAATYTVQETVPTGRIETGGQAGYSITAVSGGVYTNNNFDNYVPPVTAPTFSISGHVYEDQTGNGLTTDDTGHPMAGVTIQLFKVVNGTATQVGQTTTAADGSYTFTGQTSGTFGVGEIAPTGYIETAPTATFYQINATGTTTGLDFDNFKPVTISGTVFNDLTNNSFSSDDTVESGVTVNLYKNGGTTPVATVVTGANGTYSFTNLGGGTYTVQETTPTGQVETGGTAGYTVVATSGLTSTGNNFDNFKPFSISGHIYQDQTGNGLTSDDTSHPMAGVTVQLFKVVNGSPVQIATTTTAADGSYIFNNQTPGTFGVGELVPTGFVETAPSTLSYQINATTNTTGLDFDNYCPPVVGSLSGHVYQDQTGNGLSADDKTHPMGGVTVVLTKNINGTWTTVGTTTTAADGSYSFGGLTTGTYATQEVTPAGQTETSVPYYVVNVNGNSTGNLDFDNFKPGSLCGTVFQDCNNNGVQDSGEAGIGCVNITLTGTDSLGNAICKTLVTDSCGNYCFTGLGTGTYTITECQPAGYKDGLDSVGTLGGTLGNDVISSINVGVGSVGVSYNFGEIKNTCVTGCSGYSNCKVTLTGCDAWGRSCSYTCNTDSKGNYCFTDLCGGNYKVQECDWSGNCKNTKVFCVDTQKWQGCSVDIATLCGNTKGCTTITGCSGYSYCKVTLAGCDSYGRACSYTCYTDAKGNYSFNNICGGNFQVQECDWSNTCKSSKSFCLDATKYSNCSVSVSTLCGSTYTNCSSWLKSFLSLYC